LVFPSNPIRGPIAGWERDLFVGVVPFSPGLVVILLFSPTIVSGFLLASEFSQRAKSILARIREELGARVTHAFVPFGSFGVSSLPDYPRVMLILGLVSALLVAWVPYRPETNPFWNAVGTDVQVYIDWVDQMLRRPVVQAVSYAFRDASLGSRPLVLLSAYSVGKIFNLSAQSVVKLIPLFLGPLLVLSSYIFVSWGRGDKKLAGVAAILTAFSPAITVGVWASYYANWLALCETLLYFGVLLRFLRSPSPNLTVSLVGLSLSLLLTHPWTWILAATVSAAFVVTMKKDPHFNPLLKSFIIILSASIVVELMKTAYFQSFGVASSTELVAFQTQPLSGVLAFWPNLIRGVVLTYNGLLAFSLLLALSAMSLLRLRIREQFDRLLIIWLVLSALPLVFLDSYLQTRIIYDLPLPILAAQGLIVLSKPTGDNKMVSTLLLLAVVLDSANYAVRSMIQI